MLTVPPTPRYNMRFVGLVLTYSFETERSVSTPFTYVTLYS